MSWVSDLGFRGWETRQSHDRGNKYLLKILDLVRGQTNEVSTR